MVDEVLSENVACTHLFDFEDFDCCTFGFSSDSPHALTNNRLLEKVEKLTRKIDADVAVPFVCALLLDFGWNLLRAQFFDVKQFTISRTKADDDLRHTTAWSATLRNKRLRELQTSAEMTEPKT